MGNEQSTDALSQGIGKLVQGVSTVIQEGNIGEGVWYICPTCKTEVWALEAFAGSPCWGCTTGKETADQLSGFSNSVMNETNSKFFDRLDRYQTMDNGYLERPVTTLEQSNYLKIYKKLISKQNRFDNSDIISVLMQRYSKYKNDQYYKLITKYGNIDTDAKQCDSVPKKCVYLWSLESPMYGDLCDMLEKDDYEDLKSFMPLIRCIILFIVNHPTIKSYRTFRGSHMVMQQFGNLKTNQIYRVTKFLATSESDQVAKQFKSDAGVVITFKIPKHCYNAAAINKYSVFGDSESEVLLPPYTAIKVVEIDQKQKTMTVEVLDNKSVSLDTPQIHL